MSPKSLKIGLKLKKNTSKRVMCCRMPRRDMEQTLNMNTKNPYSILGRMINSFFHMILWCPHEFPGHSPRFETNWPQTHGREGRLLSVVGGKYMQKSYQRKAHDTNMYTANTWYSQQPWDISQN